MPYGDRTGPDGAGPMTGRAMGYCSGSGAPGYTRGGFGRGYGYGRGGGRGFFRGGYGRGMGWGRGYYGGVWPVRSDYEPVSERPIPVESERGSLKALERLIEELSSRIEKLEEKLSK